MLRTRYLSMRLGIKMPSEWLPTAPPWKSSDRCFRLVSIVGVSPAGGKEGVEMQLPLPGRPAPAHGHRRRAQTWVHARSAGASVNVVRRCTCSNMSALGSLFQLQKLSRTPQKQIPQSVIFLLLLSGLARYELFQGTP